MPANWSITEQVKDRQKRVFRIASDPTRYGLTRKAISADSGIGYDSICDYANGLTEMPVSALVKLIGVIPDELLSLLLPDGHVIVRAPDEIDHDQIAEAMTDWLATKNAAHHPESPAGRDIADCEDEKLRTKFAVVQGGRNG